MSIAVTYYGLTTNPTRASSLSSFGSAGSGIVASGTYGPAYLQVFGLNLSNDAVTSLPVTGYSQPAGFCYAFSDTQTASGSYILNPYGGLLHYTSFGSMGTVTTATNPNTLTSGTTTGSGVYTLDYTGNLANYLSGTWASVTASGLGGSAPYRLLQSNSSNNLYCIGQTLANKFTLSSPTSGTWTQFSSPSSVPGLLLDCLCLNGSNPIVAGRIPTIQADISTQVVQIFSQIISIDKSTSQFLVNEFTTTGTVSTVQTVAASGSPTYGAISLNQLLVTDATNGTVRIFDSSSGTWSGPTQTLSLTNAGRVGTSPDGTIAIVCQTASNLIQAYSESGGVWSAENSLSVSGAIDVSLASDTMAYVACASGIVQLSYTSTWELSNTYSVGISCASVLVNPLNTNYVYACGTSGGSGFAFSINISANSFTSVDWAGGATRICWVNGYICVLDTVNSTIHTLSENNNGIIYGAAASLAYTGYTDLTAGPVEFAFASGASGWEIMQMAYPFQMFPYYSSYIWQYTGSAWNAFNCGNPKIAAICFDGTYAYGVRLDNLMFKLNTSAVLQAGYPQTIPPYSGQTSNAYLGISNMLFLNGAIYFSSTEGGGIGEITGF